MKKIWLFIPLTLIGIAVVFFSSSNSSTPKPNPTPEFPSFTPTPQNVDITASFEIYTLGTKRIFTDSKYRNLSQEVYISQPNPSQIHVKKIGITWADFFATLPMKLERNCLTTGTSQTFCTNNSQKLKFFINEKEDPNALDKQIKDGDKLKVVYE
ncbi:hypothetical protein A2962_02235 [Candidatus Woesebacteria bacterium RIFCSPLOWO2_01_FULL_39_61]|uniref:Cyclophilin-like domain-containing protein n=1 Tax=Candidatus Woesebacteria bacterium RIFCSPHIGHO2_02_FULL_39_13 TaxID=1802505 RepID=A0A1F7Z4E8_9BACT|nr:MAG: hypothetical protein A2692_01250 [Candidatus Woesebacteria bacterium RIFCSPHIGHO2_01_FULL_39_95]OGM33979.1 MAG: hypothetical protein A3D01_03540 [Candidatus Woesebacteria bacterium RIFCSPHIGHO2_02_FULL_39_13]OGM38237.1 MAG: hypothetical protein A3E13_05650 [Candidatus Woesebacteria bacterium RIFCSPHIGHO2_12_FULL_40_20]OGM66943.1 MAG: hypothetical protein A2962_02235 [Candidatus Woesebacteria bacterium RIFCSPLOWO2_01_FULL_39_61]